MVLIEECKHVGDVLFGKVDEDINHAVDRTESHYIPSIIIFCNKCGKEWSSWKGEMIS